MDESRWVCEKCGGAFDLRDGEGWVRLVDETPSPSDGRLSSVSAFERVCYRCADELYAVAAKCSRDCVNCEAATRWGLSIRDCLKFQLKFGLLEILQGAPPPAGSVREAREILRIFDRP
jgi:hypothetical protein